MKTDNSGPAFPMPIAGCNDGSVYNTMEQSSGTLIGLTKREYFAGLAMQALYSNPNCHAGPEECAKDARSAADALIAELAKGGAG